MPTHDQLLGVWFRISGAVSDAILSRGAVQTTAIRDVVETFDKNMTRAAYLSQFPSEMCMFGQEVKLAAIDASMQYRGDPNYEGQVRVVPRGESSDGASKRETEIREVESLTERIMKGEVKRTIPGHVGANSDQLANHVTDRMSTAYDTIMSAQLILAWSAFETLAGDLWVKSVNVQPEYLAGLTGTGSRIERLTGAKATPESRGTTPPTELGSAASGNEVDDETFEPESGKVISLREMCKLTRGGYDLSGKMGDLLVACGRVKFTSLKAIREAYSLAFPASVRRARSKQIDAALADQSLNALSAVRNLIVHKAGVVDAAYLEDRKNAPMAPQLKPPATLQLDGQICHDLIEPVVGASLTLVKAVDTWLTLTRR